MTTLCLGAVTIHLDDLAGAPEEDGVEVVNALRRALQNAGVSQVAIDPGRERCGTAQNCLAAITRGTGPMALAVVSVLAGLTDKIVVVDLVDQDLVPLARGQARLGDARGQDQLATRFSSLAQLLALALERRYPGPKLSPVTRAPTEQIQGAPVLPWLLFGVGVVALAAGTVLAVHGVQESDAVAGAFGFEDPALVDRRAASLRERWAGGLLIGSAPVLTAVAAFMAFD